MLSSPPPMAQRPYGGPAATSPLQRRIVGSPSVHSGSSSAKMSDVAEKEPRRVTAVAAPGENVDDSGDLPAKDANGDSSTGAMTGERGETQEALPVSLDPLDKTEPSRPVSNSQEHERLEFVMREKFRMNSSEPSFSPCSTVFKLFPQLQSRKEVVKMEFSTPIFRQPNTETDERKFGWIQISLWQRFVCLSVGFVLLLSFFLLYSERLGSWCVCCGSFTDLLQTVMRKRGTKISA